MLKSFFASLFGGAEEERTTTTVATTPVSTENGPVAFVDYVVKNLVDAPEEVNVDSQEDERGTLIRISCRKDEIGRIIGKRGKTIDAIRALVKASAARDDRKVSVVVLED